MSTGLRDPGPNADKFDAVMPSFANKQQRYYRDEMQAVTDHFKVHGDANIAKAGSCLGGGKDMEIFLTSSILEAFGRWDESRQENYLTIDDARSIWIDAKYPQGEQTLSC